MICFYCSEPKVRQRHVDSSGWGRWRSGWNVSESPVVFAFIDSDQCTNAHTPTQLIRADYFTASYASKKKTFGSNPDPLSKAKKPRGRASSGSAVKMPEWRAAPGITPRIYPQLTSYGKFRQAAEIEADNIEAQWELYGGTLELASAMMQTSAPHLNKGDMNLSYEADESRIYFSHTSDDYSVRYQGWYQLKFLTENTGTAVQYTRCRNREVEVKPMTFCIVPLSFADMLFHP